MAHKPLTVKAIQTKARPADKPFKLFDSNGLYLLVKPDGGRYWRLDYRFEGKYRTLALGVYPEVTLREARDERDKARQQVRDGTDPTEVRREQKRQAKSESANSFENVAREWHAKQADCWTNDHAHRVLHSLEKDVFPLIGDKPIAEITAPTLLQVLRRVEKRDALEYASRVPQRINAVYRYAIATARVTHNSARDLVGSLKTRKVTHRAALTRSELPELLSRLDAYSGDPETRLALRLDMLIFVRSGEVRGASEAELIAEAEGTGLNINKRPAVIERERQAAAKQAEQEALEKEQAERETKRQVDAERPHMYGEQVVPRIRSNRSQWFYDPSRTHSG